MSDESPLMRSRSDRKVDRMAETITADARRHWEQGYTHFFLSIESTEYTAGLLQWVESVGWVLEHAGWVWAEKGYIGYGGIGLLNSSMVGNFLLDLGAQVRWRIPRTPIRRRDATCRGRNRGLATAA